MRVNTSIAALASAATLLLSVAQPADAQTGHLRQGVGAVNTSMGGAGAATTQSLLGTFYLNPAALIGYDGTRVEFSLDFLNPNHTLSTGSSSTQSAHDHGYLPSAAVSSPVGDRVTLGLGAIQLGGLRTRWGGVLEGESFAAEAEYQVARFTPTVAFAVSDAIWLGGSLLVDWTSFRQDPLLVGAPTAQSYPNAVGGDTEIGVGFQAGLLWNVNDFIAIGGSYASKTGVTEYVLPGTVAAPGSPSYGDLQPVPFTLETPAMLVGGLSMTPLPSLLLAADVRYLFYEDAAGFSFEGDSPFASDGALAGFGWQNVLAFNIGAEYSVSDKLALRAGYSHADAAVTEELVSVNVTTPAILKDRASFGFGWHPTRRFRIDAGYTIGFENSVTGPILTPGGALSESVTLESRAHGLQLAFTLATRGF
jgi:long-chain fatty acid transport protein